MYYHSKYFFLLCYTVNRYKYTCSNRINECTNLMQKQCFRCRKISIKDILIFDVFNHIKWRIEWFFDAIKQSSQVRNRLVARSSYSVWRGQQIDFLILTEAVMWKPWSSSLFFFSVSERKQKESYKNFEALECRRLKSWGDHDQLGWYHQHQLFGRGSFELFSWEIRLLENLLCLKDSQKDLLRRLVTRQ